jgi:large subunit ribosomal protein L4e
MKLTKIDKENKKNGEVALPPQFSEPIRTDLIKRAVHAIQNNARQAYGSDPRAGFKASAELSRRRRKYRGSYGHGISRVPRKILSRRGLRFHWVGAVIPGTVKGRRAHPPKSEKIWEQKINKKENRKAIRSAIAATINKETVIERGHHIPETYPFILDKSIEDLTKTAEVVKALKKLGFEKDLERGAQKKIRAGKGKARNRKYKKKKSVLLVVEKECKLVKAAANIPGVDTIKVHELNAEILAPGAAPGRATLWSEGALNRMAKEKLFQ